MIKWRESMSVDNNGIIDQDHKHLIEIINRFYQLSEAGFNRDEAREIAYSLQFYARTHFKREEHLQMLVSYPYLDAHHQEHVELDTKLAKVVKHINDETFDIDKEGHGEIALMLRDWLINHILKSDLKMVPFIEKLKVVDHNLESLKDIEMVD